MASNKIVGKSTSGLGNFADTDTALTPQTVQSNSGPLTVQSQDGSGVKLGTGAVVQAGKTLSTTGTGNINLPNNASARFQIEGVSVGSTVTPAALNALTNGSNGDPYHTHSNVQASSIDMTGFTLWATPVVGEIGYISATATAAKAQANSFSTANAIGVYAGTAGTLLALVGTQSLFFDAGLTTVTAGQRVWLSSTTAARVTNVEPSSGFSLELGTVFDGTGYNNGTGTALPVCCRPGSVFSL